MTTPPSWYDDPHDPSQWRYWDGDQWTGYTAPKTVAQPGPSGPVAGSSSSSKGWLVVGAALVAVVMLCGFVGVIAVSSDSSDRTPAAQDASSVVPTADIGSSTDSTTSSSTTTQSSSSPTSTSTTSTPAATKAPKKKADVPDRKVTAGNLIKEFEDNELAADLKYKGKRVQVTGSVDKIDTDLFDDDTYILDIDDGGQWSFLSVRCRDIDQAVLSKLSVDTSVTVIGDFDDGGDLGVDMVNCKVL